MAKKDKDVITIPLSVWESAETKQDLEDWLLAHNPEFVRRMLEANLGLQPKTSVPVGAEIP